MELTATSMSANVKRKRYFLTLAFTIIALAFPAAALALGVGGAGVPFFEQPKSLDLTFPKLPIDWSELRARAKQKESQSPEELRKQSLMLRLSALHDLMNQGMNREALEKLHEIDAISGKTVDEIYLIERTRLAIASRIGDDSLIVQSAQAVFATGQARADEHLALEDLLSRAYYNQKNYPQAITWIQRYLQDGGNDINLRNALASAYYFSNDYAQAILQARADIQTEEKAGGVPDEFLLRLWISAAARMNDQKEYVSALEKDVLYYPEKAYWAELLNRVISKPGFSDELSFDVYRLMLATGQIVDAKDHIEMAQAALQTGHAAQAKYVLDKGFRAGVLGHGPDAAAHRRLLDAATRNAATEAKDLEKENAAILRDKTGARLVNVGYHYIDHGQLEKAIALIEEGLRLGGLKQPEQARLHLGVAYALAGRREEALHVLRSVQGGDGAADLAKYWGLYIEGKSSKSDRPAFAGDRVHMNPSTFTAG